VIGGKKRFSSREGGPIPAELERGKLCAGEGTRKRETVPPPNLTEGGN